jgi:hypothetical protein
MPSLSPTMSEARAAQTPLRAPPPCVRESGCGMCTHSPRAWP